MFKYIKLLFLCIGSVSAGRLQIVKVTAHTPDVVHLHEVIYSQRLHKVCLVEDSVQYCPPGETTFSLSEDALPFTIDGMFQFTTMLTINYSKRYQLFVLNQNICIKDMSNPAFLSPSLDTFDLSAFSEDENIDLELKIDEIGQIFLSIAQD